METSGAAFRTKSFFIIAIFIALLFYAFWYFSRLSFEQDKSYQVFMRDVTGLSINAPVEFNGVTVGKVKAIKLNHNHPQWVELLLSVKQDTPVTKGTVAEIATGGLTSGTITNFVYIALRDNGNNLSPLTANPGQVYPVIPSVPSSSVSIGAALTQISQSLQQFNGLMQNVLNKDNVESLKELLYSMQQVMNMLAVNSPKLNTIITNTAKASGNIDPFLLSGKNTMTMFETQTLPMAYHTMADFDDLSHTLASLANEIKQNPSIIIRGTVPAPGPGETSAAPSNKATGTSK